MPIRSPGRGNGGEHWQEGRGPRRPANILERKRVQTQYGISGGYCASFFRFCNCTEAQAVADILGLCGRARGSVFPRRPHACFLCSVLANSRRQEIQGCQHAHVLVFLFHRAVVQFVFQGPGCRIFFQHVPGHQKEMGARPHNRSWLHYRACSRIFTQRICDRPDEHAHAGSVRFSETRDFRQQFRQIFRSFPMGMVAFCRGVDSAFAGSDYKQGREERATRRRCRNRAHRRLQGGFPLCNHGKPQALFLRRTNGPRFAEGDEARTFPLLCPARIIAAGR